MGVGEGGGGWDSDWRGRVRDGAIGERVLLGERGAGETGDCVRSGLGASLQ